MIFLAGTDPHDLTLATLRDALKREIEARPHLQALRQFNHYVIGELNKCYELQGMSLKGRKLLDLGASIHGYALEEALDLGVALYEGIDLDVARHWGISPVEIAGPNGSMGCLREMNAEALDYPEGTFDCLVSISTFEHFLNPDRVLKEMFRVLKPGGWALVTTEPIWSAWHGHHIHHFGELRDVLPPWGHLYLSKAQMADVLARQPWPADVPIDREEALHWIYDGDGINRFDIHRLKAYFAESPFQTDWFVPLFNPPPAAPAAAAAEYLSGVLPYSAEELLTCGLTFMLSKP